MTDFVLRTFELAEVAGPLPSDWAEQILDVAANHASHTVLDGSSQTSRETEPVAIDVFVVDGAAVHLHLPWLDSLYRTRFVDLASTTTGSPMTVSESLLNGVNINAIHGPGGRYEWHVDSNPLTGILFVSDHRAEDGGFLTFGNREVVRSLQPRRGLLAMFDARETPHTVTPLTRNTTRVSVAMNFYVAGEQQKRPSDLDRYLYGASA